MQVESPPGYVNSCLRFEDKYKPYTSQEPSLVHSPALWSQLEKINDSTNHEIYPQTDERRYGRAKYWTIPADGYGDCEDSALAKRKKLISSGLSAAALRVPWC